MKTVMDRDRLVPLATFPDANLPRLIKAPSHSETHTENTPRRWYDFAPLIGLLSLRR